MRRRSLFALLSTTAFAAACGGSSSTTATTPAPPDNVQALQVGLGPAGNAANGLFTSVTVCVPNTSSCQTIGNIEVDTGSVGLRLLSSLVTLPLPPVPDGGGNQVRNCTPFVDMSYAWGPVVAADVRLAGLTAGSVPIQLIGATGAPEAPTVCSQGGTALDSVSSLGANGLLGIGLFRQDCGPACAGPSSTAPALYYTCPNGTCAVSTAPLPSQLQNPVWLLPQDSNGLLIQLPAVPALGAPTATGSLIFGIGTRSNNGLGNARVYTTDNRGTISTTYQGTTYSGTYLDTGSNGIFFLDASTIGIPQCASGGKGFVCPSASLTLTASNTGTNGTTSTFTFGVANADALFATGNAAFNNLAGPDTGAFDWGMPFFYGRTVFLGIEGQSSVGGTGPYWAY